MLMQRKKHDKMRRGLDEAKEDAPDPPLRLQQELSHRHHYFGEGEGIRAKIEMANAGSSDYESLHIEFARVPFFHKWKYCHRALLHYSFTAGSRSSYNGCCDFQQFIHSVRMQNHQLLQNVSPSAKYSRFDSRRREPY
jgi:hypothetical protein